MPGIRLCFSHSLNECNPIAVPRLLTKAARAPCTPAILAVVPRESNSGDQGDPLLEGVSSIYDPQMGKTLARKLESQYVFNK